MQLTQEQIEAILTQAKPSIVEGLRKEVVQQVTWRMNADIAKMIQTEVEAFTSAEIIPEIKKFLVEHKEGLIKVALTSAESVVTELSLSMAKECTKNLESSYKRTKIFEALFG